MVSCLGSVLDSSKSRIHCIAHCCPVNNIKNFRNILGPTIEMHVGLPGPGQIDKIGDHPGNSGTVEAYVYRLPLTRLSQVVKLAVITRHIFIRLVRGR